MSCDTGMSAVVYVPRSPEQGQLTALIFIAILAKQHLRGFASSPIKHRARAGSGATDEGIERAGLEGFAAEAQSVTVSCLCLSCGRSCGGNSPPCFLRGHVGQVETARVKARVCSGSEICQYQRDFPRHCLPPEFHCEWADVPSYP